MPIATGTGAEPWSGAGGQGEVAHPEYARRVRGGIITHGCGKASLGYRVTAHGLRHSFGNWLKNASVPTRDIQAVLRHADLRTTNGYLRTSTEEKITAIAKLPPRTKP